MFQINPNRRVVNKLPVITQNYEVLHFDEFPILFFGTNDYGNKIIGSLVCEDEGNEDRIRYFHCITSNKNFSNFINREISYLEVLKKSSSIFVLDKDLNDRILGIYFIDFDEIPEDYLPHQSSLCPDLKFKLGFKFSIALLGALADIHEANRIAVGNITEAFSTLIEVSKKTIGGSKIYTETTLIPSTQGSFRINLNVKYPRITLFHYPDEVSYFMTQFINYCIDDLHKEVEFLVKKDISEESKYYKLEKKLSEIHSVIGGDNTGFRDLLIQNIFDSLPLIESLSNELGNGFNEIELFSNNLKETKENQEVLIGFIDREISNSISNACEFFENETDETEVDQEENEYKIHIYQFNTDSRRGFAHIQNEIDPDIMDKPKIEILGDSDLTGSEYTESLHLTKWINVIGRAKRVKGKFKKITIKGEFKED